MIRRGVVALMLPVALAVVTACGGAAEKTPPPTANNPPSALTTPPPSTLTTPPPSTSPPSAFPTAKDGQNYKACNDGNCEVLIRKHAVLTLSGQKNTATVKDGGVRLTSGSGYVSLSGLGGYVSWSNGNGPTHSATLKAAEGDTVIMVISTRR
ncbi:hypothetical protein ABZS29_05960 [Kribbella sp. NPDC005582]|uniref:hypothetical protein n=1 Tax=Kribbella sp. NPDC005582 TaxID=3156893 RepID=UPI0033BAE6CB